VTERVGRFASSGIVSARTRCHRLTVRSIAWRAASAGAGTAGARWTLYCIRDSRRTNGSICHAQASTVQVLRLQHQDAGDG
jgi:hypothetical protein